jgi:hypothetical protein
LIIGAALALRWPLLRNGFLVDDYAQLSMLRGIFHRPRAAWQLFTFSDGSPQDSWQLRAAGFFPWWSHERLQVSMFRPLSCLLMWLDLKLFALDAYRYHLHTLGWWLLMMSTLALVLRRLARPWPALLALALCCAQSSHAMFLGWIANRNAILCSGFSLLGLMLLLSSAELSPRRALPARLGALLSQALALAAGEYALGFVAYSVCYELQSAGSARERGRRLSICAGLLAGYLALRRALGFGTYASGMYIDPILETRAFLAAATTRLPVLLADLVFGLQAEWWSAGVPWAPAWAQAHVVPEAWAVDLRPLQSVQVGLGWLALGVAGAVAAVVWWRRQALRWLVLATPLALLPALGSTPETRLLFPAMFGWSLLMAIGLWEVFIAGRGWLADARVRGPWAVLYACQLLGPPLYTRAAILAAPQFAEQVRGSITSAELEPVMARAKLALLLGAADATTTIYLPLVRRFHDLAWPRACQLLSATSDRQRLMRVSANAFRLERVADHLSPLDIYATAFNRYPLQTGQIFRVQGLRVTVERAFEGRAMRTLFELDGPLHSPDVVLLQQTSTGLRTLTFPAVGSSMLVDPPIPPLEWTATSARPTQADAP